MKKTVIIDYGMGNLDSVRRACEECGSNAVISSDYRDLSKACYIVLPGVGSFRDGMDNIRKLGLYDELREQVINQKIPFLGICLGMQLMASTGHEGGLTSGFDWIKGYVNRLNPCSSERIPHIGWNEVHAKKDSVLFKNIEDGRDFYFVHSYALECERPDDILARTPYCGGFTSAVESENIFGVQFHPEKSQKNGFKLLSNFLNL